jgi:hypothetical protein
MISDDVVAGFGQRKAASGEIRLDDRPARVDRLTPSLARLGDALRAVVGGFGARGGRDRSCRFRGRLRAACEPLDRFREVDAPEKHFQIDSAASFGGASPAVENLLSDMDAEAIGSSANWTRPDELGAASFQPDAMPLEYVLETRVASALDRVSGDHCALAFSNAQIT